MVFDTDFLLVGLGNPGEEYAKTRHNAGVMFLEHVRASCESSPWEVRGAFRALSAEGSLGRHSFTLLFPQTWMNESGISLRKVGITEAELSQLIVCHDDLDLPLGTVRLSFDRGSGGHNGVRSVIEAVGSTKFVRLRFGITSVGEDGIAHKPEGEGAIDRFVTSDFSTRELAILESTFPRALDLLQKLFDEGYLKAMSSQETIVQK